MNKTLLVGFLLGTISISIVFIMIILIIHVMRITLRVSLSSRPKSSNWREQRPSSFAPVTYLVIMMTMAMRTVAMRMAMTLTLTMVAIRTTMRMTIMHMASHY